MMASSAQGKGDYGSSLVAALASHPSILERIFDPMTDLTFFVKDREGRYRVVNETLARRVSTGDKALLLGRRVDEVFPAPLGQAFRQQDERVMTTGRPLLDRLELHLYPNRNKGWCRTFKLPLSEGSRIVGLVGFSKDLHLEAGEAAPLGVARALRYLEEHPEAKILVADLARKAEMAPRTFERAVQRLFGMSAGDLVLKNRIDHACRLLSETSLPIAQIAADCGYRDHSAFSRQFRARVGVAPSAFRSHR